MAQTMRQRPLFPGFQSHLNGPSRLFTAAPPQPRRLLAIGRMSRSALLSPRASNFPHGRWTLTYFPSSPARLAAYLQQQDEASLTAFSTASRVSPVRF
jgi:hypothetical protein